MCQSCRVNHRSRDSEIREYCGVFGICGVDEAARIAQLGLHALQHRGQEGAGIVSSDGEHLHRVVGPGLVTDVFRDSQVFERLPGRAAIGHVRYSTTGSSNINNIQPIRVSTGQGEIALAHNGNLTNSRTVKRRLEKDGAIFQTSTDSEIILHLLARIQKGTLPQRLIKALQQITGAFSLVMLRRDTLIAARDPYGFRPLCLGRSREGRPVITSESCALDIIQATYERDVEPGELILIRDGELESIRFAEVRERAHCVFEYIYFSRPDSKIFGENVDKTRRKLGKNLALEHPLDGDIVMPVPDSSNTAALGYSRRSQARFELGLIRNHYVGRTFISPGQMERDLAVHLKFNTVEGLLNNRRVILVDDSIVRGTTLKKLVRMLREAGAQEVHVRISSPPVRHPCYYGMDFPDPSELLANRMSVDEMESYLEVDSLRYLSVDQLKNSLSLPPESFCMACFTGRYPEPVPDLELGMRKDSLESQSG